jgi:alkaline phosphatase
MVEGASIDKQSHPNNAAGTIWDTIEFDKSVGVARRFARKDGIPTLIVVTADHDQSLSIIGVSNVPDSSYLDTTNGVKVSYTTAAGNQNFTVFGDSYVNARAGLPFINSSTEATNNGGALNMPGAFTPVADPISSQNDTFVTYSGIPAYHKDMKTGYPLNEGTGTRRLAVGYRTGDHTGSSVPVTAEGPGALFFTGYMDETDIFFKMAATLSNDTTALDKVVQRMSSPNPALPKTFGK